jgi:hypothetical protein
MQETNLYLNKMQLLQYMFKITKHKFNNYIFSINLVNVLIYLS